MKKILIPNYTQSMVWKKDSKELVLVQNVVAGKRWRLVYLDLQKSFNQNKAIINNIQTLNPHSELEGFIFLSDKRGVFVINTAKDNIVEGLIYQKDNYL